ncbi:MAG: NAD(P)/FAD-dependent oxidoreductase [Lachnospiraceae bacterium]|nr:NAD(P)/FAD-dependent oxidoreductase [Lachnospiraceae bacterium]
MLKKQVVIVGAGVTGTCIARELSRRQLDVLIIERASDVCEGTSKANSGIAHSGYDAKPGTLKARFNIEGSRLMPQLAKELDFPYRNNGSLVLCFDEADMGALNELLERGRTNGVEGLKILSGDEVRGMEPNVSDEVVAALYAPTGGVVDPFLLTVAMAENAAVNGVEFSFDTEVTGIEKSSEGYILSCEQYPSIRNGLDSPGSLQIHADIVINAAGVHADRFHNMVSDRKIHLTPRKGEYCLLDKKVGGYVSATLFQLPTAKGKGVLVTPTVHGNLMVGPTAVDVEDPDKTDTSADGLNAVIATGSKSVKNLPSKGNIITSFAGLRAHEDGGDFIIEEVSDAPGFIDVAGIESPGLTVAPAIGRYVSELVDGMCHPQMKADFTATRQGIPSVALADTGERRRLIEQNPLYAKVICRCELVTEGEIVDAIRRPVGAVTLDGIKRRVRAGMGRCQAGFCTPKQVNILARELGVDISQITKKGGSSGLLTGYPKDEKDITRKGGASHE